MSIGTEQIATLIKEPLDALGLWVVRVRLMGGEEHPVLQIMIDRNDGTPVDVNNCEEASHIISALLDIDDPISSAYDLEVSTPGIDRPLVRRQDWVTYIGHLAKVEIGTPDAVGRRRFKGIIESCKDDEIILNVDGKAVVIDFNDIQIASLVLTDALMDFCKLELESMNTNSDKGE